MMVLISSIIIGLLVYLIIDKTYEIEIKTDTRIEQRLENIKNNVSASVDEIFDSRSLMMYSSDFKYKMFAGWLKNFKFLDFIKNLLFLSDSKLQVDTFLFLSIICILPFLIIILLTSPLLFPLSVVGFFIPTIFLKIQTDKRLNLFTQQFPDALGLLANSLRAGHSLIASFEIIRSEMPAPVSQVFKSAVDDISLGIDTKEAITAMQKIIPASMDLRFFVTAVLIQRDVGGNLTEILDTLSNTIRERFKLLGQLKAQTAQTRFSGAVLSFAPPVIGMILFIVSPEYMDPLINTTQGQIALLAAIFLLILGIYTVKKITNIEF